MIGYSQEELLGRSFADFSYPDDKNEAPESRAGACRRKGTPSSGVQSNPQKMGTTSRATPPLTTIVDGNELFQFSAIIHDITERKRVEEALAGGRVRLSSACRDGFDARSSIQDEGNHIYAMKYLKAMINGYSALRNCSKQFQTDFLHPDE